MSKREAKKQADTLSDDLPSPTVETLEDVERAALLLLHRYRLIFEQPQVALGVLDACEQMEGPFGRELKKRIILAARKQLERADPPPDGSAEGAKQRAAEAIYMVVWEYLNWMNVNLSRAAKRLLPDVWKELETLPLGPPTRDLDAAERDWARLVKEAGAERARQEAKTAEGGCKHKPTRAAIEKALQDRLTRDKWLPGCRALAKEYGLAGSTIRKTTAWGTWMLQKGRKNGTGGRPAVKSLTPKLLASIGKQDTALERLKAEQKMDDPATGQPDASRPDRIHHRRP